MEGTEICTSFLLSPLYNFRHIVWHESSCKHGGICSMDNQQVNWANVGLRMVQGLTTTIDAIRQLDAQEASLVMRLLGKTCTKMMKEGVGHQFGIALIETSAQLAMKEALVVEDVLRIISSIIGRLYFTASSEEEIQLVAQLEEAVKNYQIV